MRFELVSPELVKSVSALTRRCLAPEQLGGKLVDHRTGIYSAGTVLYEMTTGKHPFQGQVVGSLIDDILHRLPVLPSQFRFGFSSRLEEIILKCLEKDPEDRYQSSRDLGGENCQPAACVVSRGTPDATRVSGDFRSRKCCRFVRCVS